jgi:sn-glycerol 3-phosphate transport system ATP-binding protein
MNIVDADMYAPKAPAGARYLGFRPEKARVVQGQTPVPGDAFRLEGTLSAREMLGSEALYKISGVGWTVHAKSYMNEQLDYGHVVVHADRADLFYFDAAGDLLKASEGSRAS